jgi:nitrogen regulatory protein P-II 1
MKCLTLVIHEAAEQDLLDYLLDCEHVSGFTTTRVHGHSRNTQDNPFDTTRDRVLGYVPRLRMDLLVEDELLEKVLSGLRRCEACVTGLGIWWVTAVESSGQL